MKDLLDKLSSYNIFNYLFPGVLFAFFVTKLTSFQIEQKDIIEGAFVYYFFGSIVSRIGSLIVEPILLKSGFVTHAPYDAFIKAAKEDPKIEILSEANNTYRTICSLMVTIGIVILCDKILIYCPQLKGITPFALITALFLLYLFSYKKQTKYIVKRIQVNNTI